MKNRRLLSALLALTLALSLFLPAALAIVDAVPLSDREGFSVQLPAGWITMNENLENSSVLGYTPAAMYDYANGQARSFVLHFSGFAQTITLDQVARYLEIQSFARKTELNGQEILSAYVPTLGIFGIAFLDLDATGYYVIGVVPGREGTLDDQTAPVQDFFRSIRFGEAPAETAAAAPDQSGVQTVGKGSAQGFMGPVDVTVWFSGSTILRIEIDESTFNEYEEIGGRALDSAFQAQFGGKTVPLSVDAIDALAGATFTSVAVVDAVNQAYENRMEAAEDIPAGNDGDHPQADAQPSVDILRAQLDAMQAQLAEMDEQYALLQAMQAELDAAYAAAQAEMAQIQAALDEALAHITCKNCGYEFPEDAPFQFCPICGTPR